MASQCPLVKAMSSAETPVPPPERRLGSGPPGNQVRGRIDMQRFPALVMTVDLRIDGVLQQREPVVLLFNVGALVEQVTERFQVSHLAARVVVDVAEAWRRSSGRGPHHDPWRDRNALTPQSRCIGRSRCIRRCSGIGRCGGIRHPGQAE